MSADSTAAPQRITAGTFVWDKDLESLVPKYGRNYFHQDDKRSDLACPAIRPDGMSAIKSMGDGRTYDGKSSYYRSVRRVGAEIVGFDKRWEEHVKPPQPFGGDKAHEAAVVGDVKRAIEEVNTRKPARTRYRGKRAQRSKA